MSLGAARQSIRIPDLKARLAELPLPALVAGIATVAAFVLRLSQIHQSLYGDEVLAYQEIVGHSLAGVIHAVRTGVESSPPLFFVLAWFSAKLGDPTVWIRLPSLILSTATIPVIYLLGRHAVGRWAGAIGAAILALGPFSTYYGIEARPYATLAFCCALSTLALVRAVRTGQRGWWVLYAIAAAAAAYSHYTAVFVLGVQAVWSLWARRARLREPVLANLSAAALYAPWLPSVHGSYLGLYAALEPLTAHNVLTDLPRPLVGYPYVSLHAIPTVAGLVAIGVCAALGLVGLIARRAAALASARRTPVAALRDVATWSATLIAAVAVATPIGLLLYSVLGTDIWDPRNLYASVPAAAVVLGALLTRAPRRLRLLTVAVTLATLLIGTIRAISPRYTRPPYRIAARYLDRVAAPRDPIIMYPSFAQLDRAILVHLKRAHRLYLLPPRRWPSPPPGGAAYAVLDDSTAHALGIVVPHPAGFRLVARRHYSGLLPFSVLAYRPAGA
jgi:uncharacterized membrane protein